MERAARRALAPEQLASALVAALSIGLPNDGYRLYAIDPRTLLVNRLLAASDNDGWARIEWLREVYLAEPLPYLRNALLMRRGLPAVAFQERQEISWGYPADLLRDTPAPLHRELFHEGRWPSGGTIVLSLPAAERWVGVLFLYRREPDRPFRARDVAFARTVAPLCGQALAAALTKESALRVTETTASPSGIVILDRAARIAFATPAGQVWRQRLRDADPGGHAPLPTAFWSALAALRANGTVGALTVETELGPARLEATPAGEDGATAITIVPFAPPAPPDVPAGWGLTAQERAVCALVLRGATNARIAQTLSVSEHTVETHLRHIFAKTEVDSRVKLVARFFQETILLGMAAEELSRSKN